MLWFHMKVTLHRFNIGTILLIVEHIMSLVFNCALNKDGFGV